MNAVHVNVRAGDPSGAAGAAMLNDIIDILSKLGIGEGTASFVLWLLSAVVLGAIARVIVVGLLKRASSVSQTWIDSLQTYGVFKWGSILFTVAVLDALAPTLLADAKFLPNVERFLDSAMIVLTATVISRLLSALVDILEQSESLQRLPIKVFAQALQMAVLCYASLMLVSVILDKDISSLLTGLTAVGALLVYVFRDYILGWNAALQIAANDLIKEGDWIVVEGHDADGQVDDIGLTTIKIQNWDKSISIIPSYDIVSKGCRNMRSMYESGGRRIKRRFAVDGRRVKVCDDSLLNRLLEDDRIKKVYEESGLDTVTNLSLFRRWLADWLTNHPDINKSMTAMVRELNSEDGNGVVVEIYAFTATTEWTKHEQVKADIHDRVVSELYRFDLGLFQDPGGADIAALGAR